MEHGSHATREACRCPLQHIASPTFLVRWGQSNRRHPMADERTPPEQQPQHETPKPDDGVEDSKVEHPYAEPQVIFEKDARDKADEFRRA